MPYDFYSLKWCDSTAGHSHDGTLLADRKSAYDNNERVNGNIHESPYEYWVGESKESIVICNSMMTHEEIRDFIHMIKNRYRYQLFVDGLPSATMEKDENGELKPNYKEGLYIGDI